MALYLESGTIHQDHGSRDSTCSAAGLMKDTRSCSNRENEGGAGSPSPPTSMAAGPFSPAFRPGAPPGLSPLLDPGQLFHGTPTAESILAAQRAGLLGNPLGFPVSLHATLASRPAMFQRGGAQNTGANTFWHPSPASPTQQPRNNNNNNRVQRKKQQNSTVARKNQANSVKKRGGTAGRKVEVAESTIIEVAAAAMTKITASAPLSPPTSGSSPPSEIGSAQKPSAGGEVSTTTTTTTAPTSGAPTAGLIPGRDKVFTCGICHRSFGYKHVLQNHERTHTGEKPFRCEVCEKRFTRDHHLKTHMRLHTGEKPYRCDHCDRTFVQVANLRRHLRVHTGERPYACILCTSKFSDSNQLKAHMLIHKGEKPFCCNRCLGRFRRRHHLMHHKCPGAVIEDENHKVQPQSLPDDFDDDEDTTTNDSVVASSDVSCGVRRDTDRTMESTRTISSSLNNIVRTPTMEVGADDLDSLDMEEDEDDEDTNAHYSGRRKNGLILAHNNNGEKKERIRKPQEIRHVIRLQPRGSTPPPIQTSPLAPLPQPPSTHLVLPEQTEPEDLSMSRHRRNGYHSHSSGDSPLSRSPSSGLEEEEEEEDIRSNIFLQHPKFRRHHAHMQRSNGAPPVS